MELAKCRAGDGAVYIRITSEERLTGRQTWEGCSDAADTRHSQAARVTLRQGRRRAVG